MKIVCVREGRVGFHVGDVVESADPPEGVPVVIDLNFFSHIDSERSQAILASVGKDPEGNPIPKPGSDRNDGEDADKDGGE